MVVVATVRRELDIAIEAVHGGATIVQVRDPDSSTKARVRAIRYLKENVGTAALVLLNSDIGAARAGGADGVHLREAGSTIGRARRELESGQFIGKSVHTVAAAQRAGHESADYVLAGTVFASPSHPQTPPAGLDYLRSLCKAVTVPVIAIGGIDVSNAASCIAAGACGVAVVSAILGRRSPRVAAAELAACLSVETRYIG
jgi:thiamine-phosphate pyrophosphorylase